MRRALGAAFDAMPEAVRRGHTIDGTLVLEGRASVIGAESWLGRVIARLIGFPQPATDVPVTVTMRTDAQGETWQRDFGGKVFRSGLAHRRGRRGRITEHFGLLTFDLALTASSAGLDLTIAGCRLGPIRLPRGLVRSHATERVDAAGRFCFDVPISMPGMGAIVHYRGWLVPRRG
jgi:hypothetical protein